MVSAVRKKEMETGEISLHSFNSYNRKHISSPFKLQKILPSFTFYDCKNKLIRSHAREGKKPTHTASVVIDGGPRHRGWFVSSEKE